MNPSQPRIAYLTAGAAGMYCGSCLRDNALVVALRRQGVDATLVPMYTPIRTDEPDASIDRVFFGGINVYLQQTVPLFRHLPTFFDRWLDQPWLIKLLARDGGAPSPRVLGEMTLSMLDGSHGHQRKEVAKLVEWLAESLRPQLINFTNLLVAGCAPELKRTLGIPLVVTLQGDDVFLDMLSKNDRQRAIDRMRELAKQIDAFIVFNRFYAEFMQQLLDLPAEKIHVVSLGINTADFERFERRPKTNAAPTIGYLARLAPEKGLDLLVDAFIELHRRQSNLSTRLLLAGWLGKDNHGFATEQFAKLKAAGLEHAYEYLGVVDREQKLDFLARIDLLSVPTAIQDPKGLYVLESLAAGVPVVQPDHGAFPELLASTQGGRLVPPHSVDQLADALSEMLADRDALSEFGRIGRSNVMLRHTSEVMAQQTMDFYRRLIDTNGVQ